MEQERDYREMGLTRETLFDSEHAMPNWLQFSPRRFLEIMVHELREQAGTIISVGDFLLVLSEEATNLNEPPLTTVEVHQMTDLILACAERTLRCSMLHGCTDKSMGQLKIEMGIIGATKLVAPRLKIEF